MAAILDVLSTTFTQNLAIYIDIERRKEQEEISRVRNNNLAALDIVEENFRRIEGAARLCTYIDC